MLADAPGVVLVDGGDGFPTPLDGAGIDPVLVSTTDEDEIFRAFLTWADERQFRRGRSW